MKRYRSLLMLVLLIFSSLACQMLSGGNEIEKSGVELPSSDGGDTDKNDEADSKEDAVNSDFPMIDDAYNILDIGDGSVLYYTKMSLEDVMDFYRDEYTSRGYTENELLTVISDGVFSMVFDGDPSGKAVVIQSVDLGDGSRTVTIRLEEV